MFRPALIWALFLTLFAAATSAATIETFPLSTDFSTVPALQAQGTQVAGSSSPSGRAGNLDIVGGAARVTITQADTQTFGGIRSEMVFTNDNVGDERVYTWEVMLLASDWRDNSLPILMGQIHEADSILSAVNFAIVVSNYQFQVWTPATEPPTQAGFVYKVTPFANVQFGHWYKFVLHTLWKADSTGFLELYVDKVPVFKTFNRGTAYSADTPYLKIGLYDTNHTAAFGTKVAYFRNITRWSGNDGYESWMGGTPQLPPPVLRP